MPLSRPPKWADKWLEHILPIHLVDEVMGDLHEAYRWRLSEKGESYAKRMFIWEVFRSMRFFSQKSQNNNQLMLLGNYVKIGYRFLWKTRTYSSINIFGLAIGIAIAWLSSVYVVEELSFDRFHEKSGRTYRIVADLEHNGIHKIGGASYIMGEEFPKQIPAIESISRYKSWYVLLKTGEGTVPYVAHRADRDLFNILDFEFVSGGYSSFDNPDAVVISESVANRLGKESIPEELELTTYNGATKRYQISGVYKDFPANSTIRPGILISIRHYANTNQHRLKTWFDINMNVVLTLMRDADAADVSALMTKILLQNGDFSGSNVELKLQPFTKIHTSSEYETGNGLRATANKELIYLVLIIGIFCLVISSINFANFSVSNYMTRMKEVAVRKILGSGRKRVFQQFIVEIFLSSSLALVLSLVIILIIAPLFSVYADKSYTVFTFLHWKYLVVGFVILYIVTLLSGFYPSIVLSGFDLVSAIKGKLRISSKGIFNRSLLVVQFALAVFLVTGMIVFERQLDLMLGFDPGYDDSGILYMEIPDPDEQKVDFVKSEMLAISGISAVTRFAGNNNTTYKAGETVFDTYHNRVDEHYIPILKLKLTAGRNFDPSRSSDIAEGVIVNESFIRRAGLKDPVGKRIPFKYGDLNNPVVIGIVKDYHFLDLTRQMEPMVLYMSPQYVYQHVLVKSEAHDIAFINQLDRTWRQVFDPFPFNYTQLSELNKRQYEWESQIKELTQYGAIIAIFLACMGLMGVVGTHVRQRLKEVSIRKVNGATPQLIFRLFLTRYVVFTLVGFMIGITGAFYLLGSWLDKYIVRIALGWEISLISLLIISVIAFVAILSQLYKPMYLNPVKYLRDE